MVKTDACVVQLRISRRGDLGDHNCAAGNWILTKLATAFKRETPTNSSPLVRTAADRLLRVVSIEGTDMSSQNESACYLTLANSYLIWLPTSSVIPNICLGG